MNIRRFVWQATLCGVLFGTANSVLAAFTINLVSSADTGLFEESPDNNLGGMAYTIAGTINAGKRSRALFKFNVAGALPPNATVTAATLNLAVPIAHASGQSFELHRVLKDWGEGDGSGGGGNTGSQGAPGITNGCTWNARFYPAALWSAPGGQTNSDYVSAASATTAMGASSLSFSSAAMAADVQTWLGNPGTNFGWIVLIADETITGTASHIATREDSANAPILTIQYTLPETAALQLTVLPITNALFHFSFNGESNQGYTVQFRGDARETNWNFLSHLDPLPISHEVVISDPLTSSNRFYRVLKL